MFTSCKKDQSILNLHEILKEHAFNKEFTQLHKVILNINLNYGSLVNYLNSFALKKLMIITNMFNTRSRILLA